MRILFLTHYFAPEGNAPASRVHSMCRRWVRAGHEVTVITGVPNVPDGIAYAGYRNAWCQEEELDGIRVVRGWAYLAANRGTVRRALNFLSFAVVAVWRALRSGPADVVIATSPQFFCGWAGVWAARLKRTPFVLEIRDLWPESIAAVGALGEGGARASRSLSMRVLEWLEARMYRAADVIVTVGDGYRDKLVERGVPEETIAIVTNGVESALYTPLASDPSKRAQAGAGPDDFLVGYLGTVGLAHGLDVVLEAGRIARERKLERLRFVVVGDGARRAELEAKLAAGDPGNVRFLGRRPKEEMPLWLASVDACLVHLRASETFTSVLPSKIFETLAMERPILMGVRGQAAAVVRDAEAGLSFAPEDALGLVDAATELMDQRERSERMGKNGRRYVLAHYELDDLAARYVEILERVVPTARVLARSS